MGLDRIRLNASNVRYVLYTIQLRKDLSMWTAAAKNFLYEQTYPRYYAYECAYLFICPNAHNIIMSLHFEFQLTS